MVDGWNPYGPAAAGNAAMQQRQQLMAQKLIVPAVQAPPPQYSMPVSSGPDAPPPPTNPLAGLDMTAIAKLLKQANPEAKAGLFGGGQDGYQAGFMGSGIGKQNSEGADVLQQFGLYNPLPQT